MIGQTLPACCVELNINVCANGYLTEVRVDGVLREQLEFRQDHQLARWAGTYLGIAGEELYVHIRPQEAGHKQRALELADKLSRQGMMTGISRQRSDCRSRLRRLQ